MFSTLLFFLLGSVVFSSCSTSKSAYYFSWRTHKHKVAERTSQVSVETQIAVKAESSEAELMPTNIVMASTSGQTQYSLRGGQFEDAVNRSQYLSKEIKNIVLQNTDGTTKINAGLIREMSVLKISEGDKKVADKKVGDKKKNGFAIAGFILSLSVILSPLGIVLSAIGLKSEKRILALVGLALGMATVAPILMMFILFWLYSISE